MKIFSLENGSFKLDGGSMFGVVPKVLWQKVYPADENNLVELATRSMLVEDGDRIILMDNGIGDKLDERFLKHYFLKKDTKLESSLAKKGYKPEDITDVIMTHLHFDHCGGGVKIDENGQAQLAFPNATYHVGRRQWENAMNPNAREKSSFFKENLMPIQESGHLHFIEINSWLTENVELRLFNGHTNGQIIPFVHHADQVIVFTGDLIPAAANVTLAWITAFDMEPKTALEEKKQFLDEAVENNYILFFEHDIFQECCSLKKTEKGVRVAKTFSLSEFMGY